MSLNRRPRGADSRRSFLRGVSQAAAYFALPDRAFGLATFVRTEPPGFPAASTYYVDTSGDNRSSGRSASEAWKDFSPINSRQFVPGDSILLKRNCVWNDELVIHGSGAPGRPIRIAAYGAGSRPHIKRNGHPLDRCVRLINSSFLSLSNLDVSNGGAGIVLFYDHSYRNRSVHLDDIVAHDFMQVDDAPGNHRVSWSYGIGVTGREDSANNQTCVLSDLRITNTEVYNTGAGIALDWANHTCADGSLALSNKFTDVFMENLHLHDNTVPGISFVSLFLTSVSRCTVQNSVIDRGARYAATGTSALQIMYSKDVTIKNVTISNTLSNACPDNSAVDFECNNERVVLDGCTFTNNAGPAVEILATPNNKDPYSRNFKILNCMFDRNNWGHKLGFSQIVVPDWQHGNAPDGVIFGNKYINAPQTVFLGGDGNIRQIKTRNNQNIAAQMRSSHILKHWDFTVEKDLQGWTNGPNSGSIRNLQTTGGKLRGEITGVDPNIVSPDHLAIPIDAQVFLRISMQNESTAQIAQIYFITNADAVWDEKKHLDFWLNRDQSVLETYELDLSQVPAWSGTLRALRVDPEQGSPSGAFSIRSIQVLHR